MNRTGDLRSRGPRLNNIREINCADTAYQSLCKDGITVIRVEDEFVEKSVIESIELVLYRLCPLDERKHRPGSGDSHQFPSVPAVTETSAHCHIPTNDVFHEFTAKVATKLNRVVNNRHDLK
jgi:hypothetical protein